MDAIPTYVINPATEHTHTVILLHGRGDSGPDYAEALCSSRLSEKFGSETLPTLLPSWRWVFPSAPLHWSVKFEEELHMWFQADSSDPLLVQDPQMGGIIESATEVTKIIDEEMRRLGGRSKNIALGGISQGAAMGLWVLLHQDRTPNLGAFVGASCWLPFASKMGVSSLNIDEQSRDLHLGGQECPSLIISGQETTKDSLQKHGRTHPLRATPIFLGHGMDDAYVDINLGHEAQNILSSFGFNVIWKEYTGAEQEGHWYKEPEELEDIAQFLANVGTVH